MSRVLPEPSWFSLQPPSELHGPGHVARVMLWASILTEQSEWAYAVLWAAACPDLCRHDDGVDFEHGPRAAAWVRRNLGRVAGTDVPWIEEVARACELHSREDAEARIAWDHPILWLLKDADALDLCRIQPVDATRLRSEHARTVVSAARDLMS